MRTSESGSGRPPKSPGIRLILLSAISVAMVVLDYRESVYLTRIRQAASVIVYPLQVAVDRPLSAWGWAREAFASRTTLLDENARLKNEWLNYDVRLQRMAALEAENDRLRAMLDASRRIADRLLVAEILAVDPDPYRQRFTINRGLRDGAYVGQALLNADGVVGQIDIVDAFTSQTVLISDSSHGLPVAVNRTGLRTIALGTGDTGLLNLPYLTNSADVREGDLLVSSGLGGVFPPGYPVARVTVVQRRPGQSFARVIASPSAGLDRGGEVLLVLRSQDVELAAAGDSPAEVGK